MAKQYVMKHAIEKEHFKMYKDGKNWIFAGIAVITFAGVLGGASVAKADVQNAPVPVSNNTVKPQQPAAENKQSSAQPVQAAQSQSTVKQPAKQATSLAPATKADSNQNTDSKSTVTLVDPSKAQVKSAKDTLQAQSEKTGQPVQLVKLAAADNSQAAPYTVGGYYSDGSPVTPVVLQPGESVTNIDPADGSTTTTTNGLDGTTTLVWTQKDGRYSEKDFMYPDGSTKYIYTTKDDKGYAIAVSVDTTREDVPNGTQITHVMKQWTDGTTADMQVAQNGDVVITTIDKNGKKAAPVTVLAGKQQTFTTEDGSTIKFDNQLPGKDLMFDHTTKYGSETDHVIVHNPSAEVEVTVTKNSPTEKPDNNGNKGSDNGTNTNGGSTSATSKAENSANGGKESNAAQPVSVSQSVNSNESVVSLADGTATNHVATNESSTSNNLLPRTGENQQNAGILVGLLGLLSSIGLFGLARRKED